MPPRNRNDRTAVDDVENVNLNDDEIDLGIDDDEDATKGEETRCEVRDMRAATGNEESASDLPRCQKTAGHSDAHAFGAETDE